MREEKINIYSFSELSEKAKEIAVNWAITHWHQGTMSHEFEQLNYELFDAKEILVGIPEDQLPLWVQELFKSGALSKAKCISCYWEGSVSAKVEFSYNHFDDSTDADEKRREIERELEQFCISFMRKADEYCCSMEYWADEFEANEREFTADGKLFRGF